MTLVKYTHMQTTATILATLILVDEQGAAHQITGCRSAAEGVTKRHWDIALHGWGAEQYVVCGAVPITKQEAHLAAICYAESGFVADLMTFYRRDTDRTRLTMVAKRVA